MLHYRARTTMPRSHLRGICLKRAAHVAAPLRGGISAQADSVLHNAQITKKGPSHACLFSKCASKDAGRQGGWSSGILDHVLFAQLFGQDEGQLLAKRCRVGLRDPCPRGTARRRPSELLVATSRSGAVATGPIAMAL